MPYATCSLPSSTWQARKQPAHVARKRPGDCPSVQQCNFNWHKLYTTGIGSHRRPWPSAPGSRLALPDQAAGVSVTGAKMRSQYPITRVDHETMGHDWHRQVGRGLRVLAQGRKAWWCGSDIYTVRFLIYQPFLSSHNYARNGARARSCARNLCRLSDSKLICGKVSSGHRRKEPRRRSRVLRDGIRPWKQRQNDAVMGTRYWMANQRHRLRPVLRRRSHSGQSGDRTHHVHVHCGHETPHAFDESFRGPSADGSQRQRCPIDHGVYGNGSQMGKQGRNPLADGQGTHSQLVAASGCGQNPRSWHACIIDSEKYHESVHGSRENSELPLSTGVRVSPYMHRQQTAFCVLERLPDPFPFGVVSYHGLEIVINDWWRFINTPDIADSGHLRRTPRLFLKSASADSRSTFSKTFAQLSWTFEFFASSFRSRAHE